MPKARSTVPTLPVTGTLSLLDLGRPTGQDAARTSDRLEFREQFHRFLGRQFPLYRVVELSIPQQPTATRE